jgi:2-polyprenyl-6-methoxyphenol hydroxylase-like FAD-dependent oxidoreductase
VLDSAEAGANTSRAAVIHARTLEVLDSIGVTDRLLAEGVVVPVFTVRDRSSGWHVLTSALYGRHIHSR